MTLRGSEQRKKSRFPVFGGLRASSRISWRNAFETIKRSFRAKRSYLKLSMENGSSQPKDAAERCRPFSSTPRQKQPLLNDITSFLDQDTREWYTKRGILYKRGYLLYGPPGTGKSSLSLSIAGHFDLDIYILNLASVGDGILASLFSRLPQHCIILLEDVDVATQNRLTDKEAAHSESSASLTDKQAEGVTLSGLLNALDGVGSQEGRLLIMTTNYIERLDDALIRPGRIDHKLEFRLADMGVVNQLFGIVFKDGKDEKRIERLGHEFAGLVPELEFSPAEVLSLLLEHRRSPESAIAGVEAWVAKVREEKRSKLKREGSWVHSE